MKWNKDAEEAINRVPFFVRKKVKRRVEEEAEKSGSNRVSMEHVRTCQQKFLNRMEDEVTGFHLETCFGPSGCQNRANDSEKLPQKLENRLKKAKLKSFLKQKVDGSLKMHHEFRVSISDCPNACSRPQIVDVGIIGACFPEVSDEACSLCMACVDVCKEDAISIHDEVPSLDYSRCLFCGKCVLECPTGTLKEKKKGYRLLFGGKLGRHPRLGEELPGLYSSEEVIEALEKCLTTYKQNCQKGERFGEIVERNGIENLGIRKKKGNS